MELDKVLIIAIVTVIVLLMVIVGAIYKLLKTKPKKKNRYYGYNEDDFKF